MEGWHKQIKVNSIILGKIGKINFFIIFCFITLFVKFSIVY